MTSSCVWQIIPARESQFEAQDSRRQKSPGFPGGLSVTDPLAQGELCCGEGSAGNPGHTTLKGAGSSMHLTKAMHLVSFCPHQVMRSSGAQAIGLCRVFFFKSIQMILTSRQVWRMITLAGPCTSKHQAPKGEKISILSQFRALPLIYRRGEGGEGE